MKMDYTSIRQELTRRHEKTTHFTKAFLQDFIEAVNARQAAIENGIDESYKIGYVTLFHSYDKIYNSKFYNKNSCGYCVFLEIINS